MKISPSKITFLKENEIFVYGSNKAGIHGAGAAKFALKFGAKIGKDGFNRQTYGISTKDENIKTYPLNKIKEEIENFIEFARNNPHLEFLVTEIGCGLAGYKPKDIAPLFFNDDLPNNISLPESFCVILKSSNIFES